MKVFRVRYQRSQEILLLARSIKEALVKAMQHGSKRVVGAVTYGEVFSLECIGEVTD